MLMMVLPSGRISRVDHGVVREAVRADVGVQGVVGGDAVITQVDAEGAVVVDCVGVEQVVRSRADQRDACARVLGDAVIRDVRVTGSTAEANARAVRENSGGGGIGANEVAADRGSR